MTKLTKAQKRQKKKKAELKRQRTLEHQENLAIKNMSDEEIEFALEAFDVADEAGLDLSPQEAMAIAKKLASSEPSVDQAQWPSVEEFAEALETRLVRRLKQSRIGELTAGGSQMRFEMSLAITGYPFEPDDEVDPQDYEPLLTDEQYHSFIYDDAIDELFHRAMSREIEVA